MRYGFQRRGTHGLKPDFSRPLRWARQGWAGIYFKPVIIKFLEELKRHPNVPYIPFGDGLKQIIPNEYR